MKVLMISKTHTHPINNGYSWGILSMCQSLKKLGCEIKFLYIQELPLHKRKQAPYFDAFKQSKDFWGKDFYFYKVPLIEKIKFNLILKYRKIFFNYRQGIDDEYPNGLTSYINQINQQENFDICIVNCYFLSKLLLKVNIPNKCIFTEDCFAYKNLVVRDKCLHLTAHGEAKAMQRAQYLFAVQDEEFYYFRLISPLSHVYNIYSGYDYYATPITRNKNILFLSGNNQYNINGIKWFIQNVFPLIKKIIPDAQLIIGGSICKVIKEYENQKDIKLKGYIENPIDFYSLGDIAINPIFQGTGLKIKTLEAISYDKVTIVHPHSLRGIFKKEEAPLFASSNPAEWCHIICNIWGNPNTIQEIKEKNRLYLIEMNQYIKNEYKRFINDCI